MADPILHVASIESNIKDGVNVALAPKTLIVGPNASGKSAIVNAVELAVSASVSDVIGRVVMSSEGELLALAPGRKAPLLATAKLSDGSTAIWNMDEGTGKSKAKRATHAVPPSIDPLTVFPLRLVREALTGSAEKARKFFLSHVGEISDADIRARIPVSLGENYRSAMSECLAADPPVDKLLKALDVSKKRARDAKAKAKAATAVATEVGQGLAAPTPVEMLAQWRGELDQHRAAQEQAIACNATADAQARAVAQRAAAEERRLADRERVAALRATIESGRALIESKAAQLAAMAAPAEMDTTKKAAIILIRHAAEVTASGAETAECLACGRVLDPRVAGERAQAVDQILARREADKAAYFALKAEMDTLTAEAGRKATDLSIMEAGLRSLEETLGSTPAPSQPAVTSPEQMATRKAAITNLEQRISNAEQTNAAWASAKKAQENGLESKRGGTEWADLAVECARVIAELLDQNVSTFIQRVQALLPPSDVFGLELRDGESSICRFGLYEGVGKARTLHTALSGVEWARVMAAIALAIVAPGKLAVVVPEDRAFDPGNLTAVLQAFSKAPCQVILATPIEPSTVPEGWLVIRTDAKVAAAVAVESKPAPKSEPAPTTPVESSKPAAEPVQGVLLLD